MKRAILVTGFSNWGKSTLIFDLFRRRKFSHGVTHRINGVNAFFTIESHSNDDYAEDRFLSAVRARLAPSGNQQSDFFGALCPTCHQSNDSLRILSGDPFNSFNEVHLLMLRYKWDLQAELRIASVTRYLSIVRNLRFFAIEEDSSAEDAERARQRTRQATEYLRGVYT